MTFEIKSLISKIGRSLNFVEYTNIHVFDLTVGCAKLNCRFSKYTTRYSFIVIFRKQKNRFLFLKNLKFTSIQLNFLKCNKNAVITCHTHNCIGNIYLPENLYIKKSFVCTHLLIFPHLN